MRGTLALVLCLVSLGAFSQTPGPTGDAPGTAAVGVPNDLRSPRATMQTFLEAMNGSDLSRAVTTLDLSTYPAVVRGERGSQLAYRLWAILNRTVYVRLDRIPNDRDGEPFVFHIYRDPLGNEVGRIVIARDPTGAWRFTTDTLAEVDEIWNLVRDRPVVPELADNPATALPPDEWLRGQFPTSLHNSVGGLEQWQWLSLAGLVALAWLAGLLVRLITGLLMRTRLRALERVVEGKKVRSALRALSFVVNVFLLSRGLVFLGLPVSVSGPLRIALILLYAAAWLWLLFAVWELAIAGLGRRAGQVSDRSERLILPIARNLGRVFLGVGVVIWMLAALGVNVVGLVAGLGIGGAILALAAKDSVENILGSLTVLFESPYQIGDWVIVGDVEGVVEDITMRSTRIRTFNDSLVTVPNSRLVTSNIENMGRRRARRLRTFVSLVYSTPPEKVTEFVGRIRQILDEHPNVVQERSVVRFFEYAPSSLNVLIQVFFDADDWAHELALRERLLLDVWRIADEIGVEFAFPTHTVHLAPPHGPDSDSPTS
ncbi:MAG: mechanosensitive ion channel family protein [Fimbriimonadaceae bacterium]